MTQLRARNGHTVMLDRSILDEVLTATAEANATPEATTVVLAETTTLVELQLIEFVTVCVPCPGCGVYPCRPGALNGHHTTVVAVAGDLIRVAR